eukprot:TRINITY_DN3714_c0_g2_i1.p1 TRINITY_DN3714_c0_g2~~TRINITY_DN3714_c0_g2_i1.p1  ORF type:complete len:609 (-),score=61.33 TRINITY_DN3714_c0_g2_i1:438-2264(-)
MESGSGAATNLKVLQPIENEDDKEDKEVKVQITKREAIDQTLNRTSKKRKKNEEYDPYKEIVFACKTNHPKIAMAAFQRAISQGIQMKLQICHSVLFLCLGGENWDKHLRSSYGQKVKVPFMEVGDRGTDLWKFQWVEDGEKLAEDVQKSLTNSSKEDYLENEQTTIKYVQDMDKVQKQQFDESSYNKQSGWTIVEQLNQQVLDAAKVVVQYIYEQGYTVNEMTLTAEARLAALCGNADQSYELLQQIIDKGMHIKLRNFHPVLISAMLEGNLERLKSLEKQINDLGLDLSEAEFAVLAEAFTQYGNYKEVTALLYRFQKELAKLSHHSIRIFKNYFESARSLDAFSDDGLLGGFGFNHWDVSSQTVGYNGICSNTGDHLRVIDLETQEWADFLMGLEQLALKGIGTTQWEKSKGVLDKMAPNILIDGANVALYGQNVTSGEFSWRQISMAVEEVERKFPGEVPVVFLNVGRIHAQYTQQVPQNKAILEKLKKQNKLFITPKGSNDDWFWLYAVVKAAEKGYLVSNDELRDHIFELIRPKYFLKWKDRHQIHYRFQVQGKSPKCMVLDHPPNYTTCVQELKNGTWWLPQDGNSSWLCIKPAKKMNKTQ